MQSLVSHGVLGFASDDALLSSPLEHSLDAALRTLRLRPIPAASSVPDADKVDLLQLTAQLMLLLDRPDDALKYFEQCMKEIPRHSKADRQARSCLISGLQCLGRNQLRTAWTCLQRTIDTKGVPLQVQVESCAAMGVLFFRLGMRRPADAAVQRSLALLNQEGPLHATPRAVLQVLQTEFLVLDLLRQHNKLDDLAFWPRHEQTAGNKPDVSQALARIAECRQSVERFELLCSRLDFLSLLLQIAYEGSVAYPRAQAHLERMSGYGLGSYAHAARHELALACIAARQGDWLRLLMQCYSGGGRASIAAQLHFEHEYCMAKLGELSGRDDAYIKHYRQYATRALIEVRQACAYITVPSSFRQPKAEIVRDDIVSRLPSRYRKAYQFIQQNLQREDLSVKEVADSISVTERALQLAFHKYVSLSPSAVIRQSRMERIRGELHGGAASHGSSALDVAKRWGVKSRSALITAFKDAYGESPGQITTENV